MGLSGNLQDILDKVTRVTADAVRSRKKSKGQRSLSGA